MANCCSCSRVRRAWALGDVEVGGEFRHLPHQPQQARVTPPGGVRLALVFDRSAHLVGASEAVDVAAVVRQPREPYGQVLEPVGDHMNDARLSLDVAADGD